jgi:hypothetical protein
MVKCPYVSGCLKYSDEYLKAPICFANKNVKNINQTSTSQQANGRLYRMILNSYRENKYNDEIIDSVMIHRFIISNMILI